MSIWTDEFNSTLSNRWLLQAHRPSRILDFPRAGGVTLSAFRAGTAQKSGRPIRDKLGVMRTVLVHSDLRGFDLRQGKPAIPRANLRSELIDLAFEQLEADLGHHEIVLPAFNYSFTSSGRFDLQKDLPEVGALPVAASGRAGWYRSRTPVFSFLSNKNEAEADSNPFSEESFFGTLHRGNGAISLLGVGFDRLTLIHYVEHLARVPYRYKKLFQGMLVDLGKETPCDVSFHVRPLGLNLDYDFQKIGRELLNSGAAKKESQREFVLSTAAVVDVLLERIDEDELFLLNSESRAEVGTRLRALGRAFVKEDFE